MMIRDHHGHPVLTRQLQRRDRRYAVVAGQYKVDAFIVRSADDCFIDAVSVPHAVGDIVADIRVQMPQHHHQQICGAYAVDVIVAHHAEMPVLPRRLYDRIRRLAHVFHQKRIVHITQATVQIFIKPIRLHAPIYHDPREYGGYIKALSQRVEISSLRVEHPLCLFQCLCLSACIYLSLFDDALFIFRVFIFDPHKQTIVCPAQFTAQRAINWKSLTNRLNYNIWERSKENGLCIYSPHLHLKSSEVLLLSPAKQPLA